VVLLVFNIKIHKYCSEANSHVSDIVSADRNGI